MNKYKMVNKIESQMKMIKGQPQHPYELVVKDLKTGEIMYRHTGCGGLFCTVEKLLSVSNGVVEGNHQVCGWGHPLLIYYAFERIQEFIKHHSISFVKDMIDKS